MSDDFETHPIGTGAELERLRGLLAALVTCAGDHMTACDKVMGSSHPCTCGADEVRAYLAKLPRG